jgi:NADH-quinone oxidoreductase subunit K
VIPVPFEQVMILAGVIFVIGLTGLLMRRNIIFMILSLEIMLSAAALAMIAAGAKWGSPDGQVMFFFVLALASVEVSVGLALCFRLYHHHKNLDTDAASTMRG